MIEFVKYIKLIKVLESYSLTVLRSRRFFLFSYSVIQLFSYSSLLSRRFFLFSYSVIQLFSYSSCDREDAWDIIKTRGEHVVEYRDLPAFNAIFVDNGINVVLTHGESYHATIEGWKNLMPKIQVSVNDEGVLVIEDKNSCNFVRTRDNKTTFYLTFADEINLIKHSGNGTIVSNDTIRTSGLSIYCIEGTSGDINLKVISPWISIGCGDNVGSITISGLSNDVGVTNWGYGPVSLYGLKSYNAYIHHHGPGNVHINASESLSVVLYGLGNVFYMGNPIIELERKGGKGNLFGI